MNKISPSSISASKSHHPTFTLTPARLMAGLKEELDSSTLSEAQQLYADALLLNVSNHAASALAEDASITSSTKARSAPPAHSRTRAGQYEPVLYELIKDGKTEEIGRLVEKQSITITSHPNFSRSRELAKLSRELTDALSGLSRIEQHEIQQTGTLPQGEIRDKVADILAKLPAELKPRKKRTRRDEVEETTLDFIPTAMKAASEQLAIIKKRAPQKLEFKSTNQLDAVAELLPEYNSWITDGDGKRTCHVYDTEYMIPAIKRKTYEEYLKQMEKLPDQLGEWNVKAAREKLSGDIAKLTEIEELTIRRMEAFNHLHEKYEAQKGEGRDTPAVSAYQQARRDTQKICEEYIQKVTGSDAAKQLLQGDAVSEILTPLAASLGSIYKDALTLDADRQSVAEDLYVKLKHFGNFAVRLQRRENAGQYHEIFKHLIEKQNSVREALVERLAGTYGVDENDIISRMEDKKFLSDAINTFAHDIIIEDKDSKVRKAIKEEYRRLAAKLEKSAKKNNGGDQNPAISALEKDELLALDGLGHFVMAQYYPEAFKGGFVIAEFGQPGLDVLKRGDEAEIAQEVGRVAMDDMKLQVALAHAMKTNKFDRSRVKIIPLHEDPATLLHIPGAQGVLRGNGSEDSLIGNYLLDYMGVTKENAESKAKLTIDKDGKLRKLTAYDEMKRLGVSDGELQKRGLNAESLKKTLVLEGPEDMEACSDNSKRAGIIGAELAEWSVREKAIEGAKHPVRIGEQLFIIRKPKYLGQGGAVARATDVPITSSQATWQGEHAASQTGKSLAHTAHHNLLGRLYLTTTASRGETEPPELFAKAASMPHFANRLGLPTYGMEESEIELMKEAINERIASTRDDKRYDKFLDKYAEPAPNYSARPDSKKAGSKGFAEKRAIGVAAEEAGIFANVMALADIFSVVDKGSRKGEISHESIEDIKRWRNNDPALQQRLSAAALIANFVNLEKKWARGGITLETKNGQELLTKNEQTISLDTLLDAYKNKQPNIQGFDEADMVMAYLHSQFRKLEKGLLALNKKQTLIELFDEPHRESIIATKVLYDKVLERLQTTKGEKNTDRELLEGVYYLIFEQGGAQFPLPHLLEKPNGKSASAL
ncbi:MAG: hypothetical protein SFW63_00945 [Alphaproteobacteria bacterium]|nr:hypothetical protein [Alphaproteobacteria bacterium]